MAKYKKFVCCFCDRIITDEYGCNPAPLRTNRKCCNKCDLNVVLRARIRDWELTQKLKAWEKTRMEKLEK